VIVRTTTPKLTKCDKAILYQRSVHPKLLRTAPPSALTSIPGVLRQAATPSDVLPKGGRPTTDYSVLWIKYVRLLATSGNTRYFLSPGIYDDPLPAACRATLSAKERREEAQDDREQRQGSVSLEPFDRVQGGNEGAIPLTKQAIEHGNVFIFPASGASATPAYGIVPDGVATVTVSGRSGRPVSSAVADNFFLTRVPVSLQGTADKTEVFTVQWHSVSGALIKTLSVKIHVLSSTIPARASPPAA
jgi:hypothetical protein